MTTPELKRYAPTETPDGLFGNVDMAESDCGEYVRHADVEAYTRAAIEAATMGAVKPLEWDSIKTAPRNGEWFFAKTARGTIRFVHFVDIYDRFPISHDHTEIWGTEPVEWISPSRALSALSIPTDATAALQAMMADAERRGRDGALDEVEKRLNKLKADYLSPEYAYPQPVGSIIERMVVGKCQEAARALKGGE